MGQLDDKTSLVTGASSGIGLSIARRFAAEGATVYLTGRRKAELDTAVARVGDLDRLYAEIAKRSGRLDIVVANAGAGGYGLVTVAGRCGDRRTAARGRGRRRRRDPRGCSGSGHVRSGPGLHRRP
jgi:NAD(P)-dependent dehydrogenase (short-subunit alcohol dehydrogenase family)